MNANWIDLNSQPMIWSQNGQQVLDTRYPLFPVAPPGSGQNYVGSYPTSNQVAEGDSPGIILTGYKYGSVADYFDLFLMFKPDGAGSRYVPLKRMNWSWHGAATKDAQGIWSIGSSGASADPAVDESSHPVWTINARDGSIVPAP